MGSYDNCMNKILKFNLKKVIKKFCKNQDNKLLGICVGMQILSNVGFENKNFRTWSNSRKVDILNKKINKLPHIGWNNIEITDKNCPLIKSINNRSFLFCA